MLAFAAGNNNKYMEEEIWKDVVGYSDLYKISSFGRIKSFKKIKITGGKLMYPAPTNQGYLRIKLSKNNKSKTFSIHRLVMEAFELNDENKRCVNHKNGIKNDNRLINLEWMTHGENMRHALDVLHNTNNKAAQKRVLQYSMSGDLINSWVSMTEASKSIDIDHRRISDCCRNIKPHLGGGFLWKFE